MVTNLSGYPYYFKYQLLFLLVLKSCIGFESFGPANFLPLLLVHDFSESEIFQEYVYYFLAETSIFGSSGR